MSVGIGEFDSHHRRLIELINKLHGAILAGDDHLVLSEVLAEVANYTLYHFFAEEAVMQRCAYPGYDVHREEHLRLTEKTLGLVQELHEKREGISNEVLTFLVDWLRHHIQETDKSYGPFLNAKGVN